MIEIKKFQDVFGIKLVRVDNGASFSRINIIYAPNGTGKTSLADALEIILSGQNPSAIKSSISDVRKSRNNPEYDITIDGHNVTNSISGEFPCVRFSGDDYELKPDGFEKIVISPKLVKKFSAYTTEYKNAILDAETILNRVFGGGKPLTEKMKGALLQSVGSMGNGNSYVVEFLTKFDFRTKPYKYAINLKEIENLGSSNGQKAITDPNFQKAANAYFRVITNKAKTLDQTIFVGDFTLSNLKSFVENGKGNHFFDAPQRGLSINGTFYDLPGIEKTIAFEEKRVYADPDVITAADNLRTKFPSNNEKRALVDFFSKNYGVLRDAYDSKKLLRRCVMTLISDPDKKTLRQARDKAMKQRRKIASIVYKGNEGFEDVWKDFQSRFQADAFNFEIRNARNASLGLELPVFVRSVQSDSAPITDPERARLSTGEKRIYNFANVFLDLERRRRDGKPFLLLLDDAVDSFDYKNKYGFVNYLQDISADSNISMLVFTHNFDFFRSFSMAVSNISGEPTKWFLYKNSKGELFFHQITAKHYLEVTHFNRWKGHPTLEQYFSLLIFARTLIQLESSGKDTRVKRLDSYMHYSPIRPGRKTFASVHSILKGIGVKDLPTGVAPNTKFYNCLIGKACSLITTKIKEDALEEKLTVGFAMRVMVEYILYRRCKRADVLAKLSAKGYLQWQDYTKLVTPKHALTKQEECAVRHAAIIANPSMHVNGFMYEPIIDLSGEELADAFQKIYDIYKKRPLK